jgi:hypothetical protein
MICRDYLQYQSVCCVLEQDDNSNSNIFDHGNNSSSSSSTSTQPPATASNNDDPDEQKLTISNQTTSTRTVVVDFLLFNQQGLTANDLTLEENFATLSTAFQDMVATVIAELQQDDNRGNDTRERFLSGVVLQPNTAQINLIQDYECDANNVPTDATCQKVQGSYTLNLEGTSPEAVEPTLAQYTTATETAITDGTLHDLVQESDPDWPFVVSGIVPRPTGGDPAEAEEGNDKMRIHVDAPILLWNSQDLPLESLNTSQNVDFLTGAFEQFVTEVLSEFQTEGMQQRHLHPPPYLSRQLAVILQPESVQIDGLKDYKCLDHQDFPNFTASPFMVTCHQARGSYGLILDGYHIESPHAIKKQYTSATEMAIAQGRLNEIIKTASSGSDEFYFPFEVFAPLANSTTLLMILPPAAPPPSTAMPGAGNGGINQNIDNNNEKDEERKVPVLWVVIGILAAIGLCFVCFFEISFALFQCYQNYRRDCKNRQYVESMRASQGSSAPTSVPGRRSSRRQQEEDVPADELVEQSPLTNGVS